MIDEDLIYENAIEKWGIPLQEDMIIEECAELIQAIIYQRTRASWIGHRYKTRKITATIKGASR